MKATFVGGPWDGTTRDVRDDAQEVGVMGDRPGRTPSYGLVGRYRNQGSGTFQWEET